MLSFPFVGLHTCIAWSLSSVCSHTYTACLSLLLLLFPFASALHGFYDVLFRLFLAPFYVSALFLAPFCVSALFLVSFCVSTLFLVPFCMPTFVSRTVSCVLRCFLLHVAFIAWFYRYFVLSPAFAFKVVMFTAWSSHGLGFTRFGTQTALLSA